MRSAAALALSLLAAALVYGPTLGGDFVYDDPRFVSANPAVEQGVPLARYFTDPGTQAADRSFGGLYRPLRTISFRVVRLIGEGPAPQRAANLLLHLLNGLLLFFVLRAFGCRSPIPAGLGVGLFLLHPAAVEATAWISSRGDLLALTFGLFALLLHLRPGFPAATCSVAAFLAALLSKESALFFPLAFLLMGAVRREPRWRRLAAHAGILVVYVLVRFEVLGTQAFGQEGGIGLGPASLTAGLLSSGPYYAALILFPWWISFEIRLVWDAATVAGGFLLLSGVLAAIWVTRRRQPGVCIGLAFVVLALLPVTALQYLIPLKIMVANRFAYPALVGVSILGAMLSGRGRKPAILLTAVVSCFLLLTLREAPKWVDSRRLWTSVLSRDPDNPVALFGLGFDELRAGDPRMARDLLVRAARIDPGYPKLAVCLGRASQILAGRSAA
ncbi:MAG: hypothetical protein MUE73_22055, partial [Planctomycetes bacterium]|nr:hypothetical protein [Planctomycetota bacterium]